MKFVLMLTIAIFLSSCASHGNEIDINYVKKIEGSITSETDILTNMGKPTIDWPMQSHGKKMIYIYAHSSARASFMLCEFFGGLTCSYGNNSTTTQVQTLTIYFDNSGLVSKLGYQLNGVETELTY